MTASDTVPALTAARAAEDRRTATVHGLVARCALQHPDTRAVVFRDRALTYRELHRRATDLARQLRRAGVSREAIVGLDVRPSADALVALLGILEAGGAYLPIDPGCPRARVDYMLAHSDARLLLTQGPWAAAGRPIPTIDLCDRAPYDDGAGERDDGATPADLAYVMYTSGSTGSPKGVAIEHRSVVSFVDSLVEVIAFTPGKTILALTTLAFDISIVETLLPLTRGMTVVVADEQERADGALLRRRLLASGVDMLQVTPSRLRWLLGDGEGLASLRNLSELLVGGEPFADDLFARLEGAPFKTYNLYGPTETTVYSIVQPLERGEKVTIGKPLANTRAYIVDDGQLQGPGGEGELLLAGAGLARGYLGDPQLTAERFIEPAFRPGERAYRTGDRARWTADGEVDYLGRVGRPIKVRGYKVELGEIETILRAHPQVRDALVEIEHGPRDHEYLCAYVVPTRRGDVRAAARLRDYLAHRVPAYMVPSFFVELDRVPLTPNGKIDRRALPPPQMRATDGPAAPRGELDARIRGIWAELLGVAPEALGIDESFFHVGGSSLTAALLLARIHRDVGVNVPAAVLFDEATIQHLADYLASAAPTPLVPIGRAALDAECLLSAQQARVFFLQRLAPANTAYNLPEIYRVSGHLDCVRLEEACRALIARHESLRTSFHDRNGTPVQRVHPAVSFEIAVRQAEGGDPAAAIRQFVRPFELDRAPLLRVAVVKTSDCDALLMLDVHHIVADGLSRDILARELRSLWAAEPLPPVLVHYRDYVAWQQDAARIGALAADRVYWLGLFADRVPRLSVPTDLPRPSVRRFVGRRLDFEIDASALERVTSLAAGERASVFTVLFALTGAYFGRLSGQQDLVIGSPIAGRGHPDLAGAVGLFANTLALRVQPSPARSFREHVREVRTGLLAAFDHQDYQFDQLVADLGGERDPGRNPLFDVMFVLQETETEPLDLPGVALTRCEWEQTTSKVDLTIGMQEAGGRLVGYFEYDTDLFERLTVELVRDRFLAFADAVLAHPAEPMGGLDVRIEAERLLRRFDDVDFDFPSGGRTSGRIA